MNEQDFLAQQFDTHRAHLRGVAYRLLGSLTEADDAVQEAWLRLNRTDSRSIENLRGWLTTVVARVSLDMLRAHTSRREEPLEEEVSDAAEADPNHEVMMAESVGLALMVVLQKLTPAERIAFVLHDFFDFRFDEIGPIIDRTPTAARQLASRARSRVQGKAEIPATDFKEQRTLVEAFLAASRAGNFEQLLALLDPNVVIHADETAQRRSGTAKGAVQGAEATARFFMGRAVGTRPALVNGVVGAVVASANKLLLTLVFEISDGKIRAINAVADPEQLALTDVAVFED